MVIPVSRPLVTSFFWVMEGTLFMEPAGMASPWRGASVEASTSGTLLDEVM